MLASRATQIVSELKTGTHACYLYESDDAFWAVLAAYFTQGIERGERCVYLTDRLSADQVVTALRERGVPTDRAHAAGRLDVQRAATTYLDDGAFVPDRVLARVGEMIDAATREGHAGLRAAGEPLHGHQPAYVTTALVEYESRVNDLLVGRPCVGLCQYGQRHCSADVLLQVLAAHPTVVVDTQVYENLYYLPPAEMLGAEPATAILRRWLGTLAERTADQQTVRSYTARLEDLSRQLVATQEAERRTLARELHDEIGQALTSVKLHLATIPSSEIDTAHATCLEEAIVVIEQLLDRVRERSLDLRPAMLDDLGLLPALRWYVDRQAQRAGFRGRVEVLRMPDLPNDVQTACFRVAQEALTNVARHARARRVLVRLRRHRSGIELIVRDDGNGFEPAAVLERAAASERLGIIGMRERVALHGGKFEIDALPGRGTTVRAWFPVPPGG